MPSPQKKVTEEMLRKRYAGVHFGRVHVHLPLHLLYASETMVPRTAASL